MKSPLLEIAALAIEVQGRRLVEHLDLRIGAGETHALVGESGSGKSLSALAILGLLPRGLEVRGARRLDGVDLGLMDEAVLRRHRGKEVGLIFQEPMTSLNPLHTVGRQVMEAIALHRRLPPKKLRQEALGALAQVRLPTPERLFDAYPHTLSGGQRQRVMIAIAIANRPRLLIADEPTTALDVTVAREILDLLDELKRELGMGLLLITHDLNLVRRYADSVSVMREGRLVEQGSARQVLEAPSAPYTRALIDAEPSGAPLPIDAAASEMLRVEGLSVRYAAPRRLFGASRAPVQALSGLDLHLVAGETLGVVGESGSGKTTLAKTILGMQRGEGRISFLGHRVEGLSARQWRPLRGKLQFVFQDPYGSLSPRMSVLDIVAEGIRHHQRELGGAEIAARVHRVLEDVELETDVAARYPHEFSGGQRARIALARALVLEPELLILDEPTAALDRRVQARLIDLLRRLQERRHLGYLLISHDLAVVKALAHRVLVLKAGEVVETGSAAELFARPREAYTRRLVEASLPAVGWAAGTTGDQAAS